MFKKSAKKEKLVLIDGSALVYRAYYALPPLTTNDGILVNAVYGFTSTLFQAIKNFHPDYIAVAFDTKKPTFRHQVFKQYKATRPKAPENLIAQIPLVREVCKVLNVPVFEKPGYEADDLIGTISKFKIKNLKLKIIIVTGDMDTLQLVDKDTQVYSMARGINKAVIYDKDKVKERYGFDPEYLVDYKALRGDPSDNIPGVPGIGKKIATQLIKRFGTIENLYAKISNSQSQISEQTPSSKFQISKKLRDLLLKYQEQAFLSKKLATIICDVPIRFKLSDCKVHDYDKKEAEKLFRKLEFKSLITRMPETKQKGEQGRLF